MQANQAGAAANVHDSGVGVAAVAGQHGDSIRLGNCAELVVIVVVIGIGPVRIDRLQLPRTIATIIEVVIFIDAVGFGIFLIAHRATCALRPTKTTIKTATAKPMVSHVMRSHTTIAAMLRV